MWRNRLWLRLWLASAFVLVVAVLTAAFVAHLSSTRAFAFYIARGNAIQQQRVQQILGRFHDARGDWAGVGVVLKTLQPPGQGPILLFDPAGRLIAGVEPGGRPITPQDWSGAAPPVSLSTPDLDDSPGLFAALDPEEVDPAVVPVTDEIGNVIARVQLPAAPVQGLLRDRGTAEFVATLTRSLFLGALGGCLVALVISLVVSRRIVAPVEALTIAVRRMGAGDLKQRVAVDGVAEIVELSQAFNAMAEQVARDRELRQHLVADVAHELRTPLSNVCGYLEALRDGVIAPRPEVIASIHDEANLLKRLIEDLQELSLVEAGQLRLHQGSTDVATLLDRAVGAAAAAAAAKGIELTAQVPDGLPPVWVDESRIAQVLRNLLANAITHTPEGGQVVVAARLDGAAVAVSVTDTGPGIAASDLPLIFERFYRTDQSRARATGGAGLGLTITRQLVQAQGGTIEARSAPSEGATFTFTVPAVAPDRGRPAADPHPAVAAAH